MDKFIRNNAWNAGGGFSNPDLLWYAKGVRKMMSRSLDDSASWWFFAAIHGEYVNTETSWYVSPPAFPDWAFISQPPRVPTAPLPSQAVQDKFWNQCQHQSWYFFPWHRGYLLALEAQLRQDIMADGGPANWALPYWDYFGGAQGAQYQIPPAFLAKVLPDGSDNPLYAAMRYGPDLDGKIYVPTPAGELAHPNDPNFGPGTVLEDCLNNDIFSGSDAITKPPGFGGPPTSFHHGEGTSGNAEGNPHNHVHVYVGGVNDAGPLGIMSDPGTAALDPVFYIHHSNIDRIWASWNAKGNSNPTDSKWLNGPTRRFVMPWPTGTPWVYTPMQVDNLNELNYVYQELADFPVGASAPASRRLSLLGAKAAAEIAGRGLDARRLPKKTELIGASGASVRLLGAGVTAPVHLDDRVRRNVTRSLVGASIDAPPDRVYLKLEHVRGTSDATNIGVYINLPKGAKPGESPDHFAGGVALFGLRRASAKDGHHAGEGLSFILDITNIVDQLHLAGRFGENSLNVSLIPRRELPKSADISVGRISVFRQSY